MTLTWREGQQRRGVHRWGGLALLCNAGRAAAVTAGVEAGAPLLPLLLSPPQL